MQLVLDQKGRQLVKGQRALRAYCNLEKPPKGFKGNPHVEGEIKIERELTHFHLSRYLYARSLLEESLFDLVEFKEQDKNDRMNRKPKGPKRSFTMADILATRNNLESLKESKYEDMEAHRKAALGCLNDVDEETLTRINNFYDMFIAEFIEEMDGLSLYFSNPEYADNTIKNIRKLGNGLAYSYLLFTMQDFLTKEIDENDRNAVSILWGIIYSEINSTTYTRDRVVFDKKETSAWRIIRRRFLTLSIDDVYSALKIAGITESDTDVGNKMWIRQILNLHRKYATIGILDFNECRFLYEATPFAEKPVGRPTGNFELAIYPTNLRIKHALRLIADPTFEHADGAIALASFTVSKTQLILEEIQSDVPDLLRRSSLNGEVSELRDLTENWQIIALSAARNFARKNGFSEFFASTPWRIFWRYIGNMHPDKTRLYFETMEKLGGELVYDDKKELGLAQYYYRFDV